MWYRSYRHSKVPYRRVLHKCSEAAERWADLPCPGKQRFDRPHSPLLSPQRKPTEVVHIRFSAGNLERVDDDLCTYRARLAGRGSTSHAHRELNLQARRQQEDAKGAAGEVEDQRWSQHDDQGWDAHGSEVGHGSRIYSLSLSPCSWS